MHSTRVGICFKRIKKLKDRLFFSVSRRLSPKSKDCVHAEGGHLRSSVESKQGSNGTNNIIIIIIMSCVKNSAEMEKPFS